MIRRRRYPPDVVGDRLIAIYAKADRELAQMAASAIERGASGTARYYTLQSQRLRREIRSLKLRTARERGQLIRSAYLTGTSAIDRVVHKERAFSGIDQSAMEVLAANLEQRLQAAEDRIGREADDVFRRAAIEVVATTTAEGLTSQQRANKLAAELRARGITAFTDKRGRRWSLRAYTAMVVRTTTREAMSRGMANRLLDHGRVEVEISQHVGSCEICKPFEGKRFSLTDAGTAPLLEKLPPFHPNCRHVLTPARTTFEEMEAALGLGPREDADKPEVRGHDAPAPVSQGTHPSEHFAIDAFPKDEAAIREQLAAIESVHGMAPGFPEQMPVAVKRMGPRTHGGQHRFTASLNERGQVVPGTWEISLNTTAMREGHNSVVHEVGHAIDVHGFGGGFPPVRALQKGKFTSGFQRSEAWDRWRSAMRETNSFAFAQRFDPKYAGKWEEGFARAYEQWIATRSGNEKLKAQLQAVRDEFGVGHYWPDDEFEPIAEALDQIFSEAGLLRLRGAARPEDPRASRPSP